MDRSQATRVFSLWLYNSDIEKCVRHVRDVVLSRRDVGLSAVVPNEHAWLVFQHATFLHDVLDPSQPTLARLEIPSRAGTARPEFTRTLETEPAWAGPLTSARVNGV